MLRIDRNLIFVGVAIVLGLAASFMAVHYVNSEVAARTQKTPGPAVPTRQVVVPQQDLEKGAILSKDALAIREIPADLAPADAITPDNWETYLGQALKAPLAHGAPISASAIELVTEHFSTIINPDDVAYTIEVNEVNSVSGMIVPGDHIDLLLLNSGADSNDIRPLLSDVLVLATGKRAKGVANNSKDGDSSYSDLTMELAPADAQRVGMALKVGELRVLLRSPGSTQPFNLKLLSKEELLRMGRAARRSSGIEFIIGGNS